MGEEEPSHSLSKETGLAYIPMFSPVPHRSQPTTVPTFSGEEMQEFSTGDSFENCSDPVRKDQFSKWKAMYRPFPGVHFSTPGKSPVDSTIFHSPMNRKDSVKILQSCQPLKDVLHYPSPAFKLPPFKSKSSSRVLTSSDNLKSLDEKKRKKEEEIMLKEKRKQAREEKRKGKILGKCV